MTLYRVLFNHRHSYREKYIENYSLCSIDEISDINEIINDGYIYSNNHSNTIILDIDFNFSQSLTLMGVSNFIKQSERARKLKELI